MTLTEISINRKSSTDGDPARDAMPKPAEPTPSVHSRKPGQHGGRHPLTNKMVELAKVTRELTNLTARRKKLMERFCQLKREVDQELASIKSD